MLRATLTDAMKTALREKDSATLSTVRLILAALKDKDIAARPAGNADGISDGDIGAMLQNMIKQRRDSIALYEQGNRPELVAKEQAEIAVIERFLPSQMDAAAVDAAIAAAVAETGAASVRDMGKVMAVLKSKFAGQMDFAAASAQVKAKLGG
ncbi:GatB/YqeY domain-containing protein [Roseiterribacter gracilis]|uniref:Aspartyl-tRNA amidotransferase subunit B n=1 Tax=Roseiterribacter gracilis TaxID=2812848 RepID=A0A8S8X9Y7_9PROT|nr:aspartyl-tRNA amidotransferase subunit B [Rhodospirillales bacterium TMPK1]